MSFSYLLFPGIHNINLKARQAEKVYDAWYNRKNNQLQQAGVSKATALSGFTVTVAL